MFPSAVCTCLPPNCVVSDAAAGLRMHFLRWAMWHADRLVVSILFSSSVLLFCSHDVTTTFLDGVMRRHPYIHAHHVVRLLAAAQNAMTASTGDNTALASAIATYSPSNKTLTCLATAIIRFSGQDAIAQSAAVESYQTVVNQTFIGAGATNTTKVRSNLR